ncbi:YjcZ family sporulation protein [Sporolactobacillus shoreae]|uniref:YjcZ family sporulation protein n=1 Tax=Sporolactobacillus shoreae TaxID=1465501 RepID=A0A4Z0GLI8_9BACL|nr:YjcZ family sporulation protein [Sporolactobacillus shoreae]
MYYQGHKEVNTLSDGGYSGGGYGHGSSFALIVVLFILLIIVGTAFVY